MKVRIVADLDGYLKGMQRVRDAVKKAEKRKNRRVVGSYAWHYVGAVIAVIAVLFCLYSAIKLGTGQW